MKKQLLFIITLGFCLSINAQTELLVNGNFASGSTGWSPGTDWYCNSIYTNCCVCNGYAHADNGSGSPKTNLNGYLEQTRTLPSNASSPKLSFCTGATLSGTSAGTEKVFVYIYDNTLGVTNSIATISFPSSQSYSTYTYSVPNSCIGHSITVGFHAVSTTTAATIRVDEVSLTYNSSTCTNPTASVNSPSGSGPLTMTCTTSGASAGTIAYKWYNGSSCSGTVIGTNSTLSVSASGPYSCKAYVTGFESTCSTCATGTATITNSCTNPTATVNSPSGTSPLTMSCVASGGSGGAISYKWFSGTSCSGTVIGTNSTLSVTSSGSYSCKAYITGFESTCYTCATGTASISTNSLLHGVDISAYNNTVSWSQVYTSSPSHSFAYIKATEGKAPPPSYDYFNSAITSPNPYGVVLGAYHIGTPEYSVNNTADAEASYFLNIAGNYIGDGFLPAALDMEQTSIDSYIAQGHSYYDLAVWINAWCTKVHDAPKSSGRWPVLYISRSGAACLVQYRSIIINENIKLWIATQKPGTSTIAGSPGGFSACGYNWNTWPWLFHQYTVPSLASNNPNESTVSGMDQDVFNGDQAYFNNLINVSAQKPDLTITAGTQSVLPITVQAGSDITASASEDNSGNASSAPNVVGLWLSADATLSTTDDVYLGSISGFPSLTPNTNSLSYSKSVTIPSNTAAGTYRLFFWADNGSCRAPSSCNNCSGDVSESNECNNFASVTITVTQVQGCSTPLPPITNTPTNITANSFQVSWNASTGATSYFIDVSTSPTFSSFVSGYHDKNLGNVTTYNITGLSCNTTYYYQVRAYNTNCGVSTNAPGYAVTTSSCCPTQSAPVSANPTGITANAFTANWNSVSGATGYRLDVSALADFSAMLPSYNNIDVGNNLSKSITGLSCGTTYYYRVRAYNSCGNISFNSGGIFVNTNACSGCPVQTPPVADAPSNITSNSFQANWSAATGATKYFMDVFDNAALTSIVPAYNNLDVGNVTSLNITGLTCNKTYYYVVRAANSCDSRSTNSAVVPATTVACCTPISITSQPSNLSIDYVSTGNFTVGVTGSNPTYQWQFYNGAAWTQANAGVYSGSTTPTLTITNPSPGINGTKYRCVVTNSCGSVTTDEVTLTVLCLPPKDVTITSSTGQFSSCGPATLTLTASMSNCNNSCGFQWSNGTPGKDLVISGLTQTTPFEVTATNLCGSTKASQTVTIYPVPVLTATAVPNPICQNERLSLSANGANSYTWTGDNLNAITGANVTANPAVAGNRTYTVTGTANGCSATSTVQVTVTATVTGSCITTAVPNVSGLEEFSVSPNPNPGLFTVTMKFNVMKNVQFRILNLLGQSVYTSEIFRFSGTVTKQISKPTLANGIYQLETRIENKIILRKIVIMH